MSTETIEWMKLKDEGNKLFNDSCYAQALDTYTKALDLLKLNDDNRLVLYKNRAAVYLKLNEYENVVKDCSAVLSVNPSDTKALFRRCQALEQLERYDEAYKDAKQVHNVEPKNSAIQPYLGRLHCKVQEMMAIHSNTSNKIDQMFDFAFGDSLDKEKKLQAVNNLIVLARDKAGSNMMFSRGIVYKLMMLLKMEQKNTEVITACIRIFGELCKGDVNRTKAILKQVSIPVIIESFNSTNEMQVNAAQCSIQTILNTLSGMDRNEDKKPDKNMLKENDMELMVLLKIIVRNVASRSLTARGRDALLEIIMKNSDYAALHWGEKILQTDGVQRILEVGSELKDYKYESSMEITDDTHSIVAATLEHIYDALSADKYREEFRERVNEFVKDQLRGGDVEPKVRVTAAITVLLQGALDVGNYCIAQQGVIEMMLVMANTDDLIQQRVAAEALVAAASKKDKCSSIITLGIHILKKLYNSNSDNIRVRALVGLCKLGSYGGTDAAIKPFADGSAEKLSSACRKFLINPAKDRDLRKWAAEGLSYLTLNADIKEELIADKIALQALIELAKTGDLSVLYGVVTTFVNLCNCYDKQEIIPEMIKLAKFAKQHIPEDHQKDEDEFVATRIKVLAENGITSALVALSKTESRNSKELIARVFNSICEHKDLRGIVVQQGGAKALIPMALDGTDMGKRVAAQALSRIAITINPEVAFPGQRAVEVVRPIMQLLHPDCSGLQNFEALMAICNLAHVNKYVWDRIEKDHGLSKIESYMYEDHTMIKRAAVQCLVNLIPQNYFIRELEGQNDRVKYWTLLCQDEDFETAKAAASGLARITDCSKKCCKKVFEAGAWLDSLRYIISHEDPEMRHRGTYVLNNLMQSSKSVAEKLVETDIMELLMVVSLVEDPKYKKSRELAKAALAKAEEWKLIKPRGEGDDDDEDDIE